MAASGEPRTLPHTRTPPLSKDRAWLGLSTKLLSPLPPADKILLEAVQESSPPWGRPTEQAEIGYEEPATAAEALIERVKNREVGREVATSHSGEVHKLGLIHSVSLLIQVWLHGSPFQRSLPDTLRSALLINSWIIFVLFSSQHFSLFKLYYLFTFAFLLLLEYRLYHSECVQQNRTRHTVGVRLITYDK